MVRKLMGVLILVASSLSANPECYKEGYGKIIESVNDSFMVVKGGKTFDYETTDVKQTWVEKLEYADLKTQLEQKYEVGEIKTAPMYLSSPGRLRYMPFFDELYGDSQENIEANLVEIDWPTLKGSKKIKVNKNAGAKESLYKIGQELKKLSLSDRKWVEDAFTYKYRKVKDSSKLSLHSYGIGIDLLPAKTQYWKRDVKGETTKFKYKNTMPYAVVQVFEKNGWIWGGRWYHYDTMHFEYRPELLAPSCVGEKK